MRKLKGTKKEVMVSQEEMNGVSSRFNALLPNHVLYYMGMFKDHLETNSVTFNAMKNLALKLHKKAFFKASQKEAEETFIEMGKDVVNQLLVENTHLQYSSVDIVYAAILESSIIMNALFKRKSIFKDYKVMLLKTMFPTETAVDNAIAELLVIDEKRTGVVDKELERMTTKLDELYLKLYKYLYKNVDLNAQKEIVNTANNGVMYSDIINKSFANYYDLKNYIGIEYDQFTETISNELQAVMKEITKKEVTQCEILETELSYLSSALLYNKIIDGMLTKIIRGDLEGQEIYNMSYESILVLKDIQMDLRSVYQRFREASANYITGDMLSEFCKYELVKNLEEREALIDEHLKTMSIFITEYKPWYENIDKNLYMRIMNEK